MDPGNELPKNEILVKLKGNKIKSMLRNYAGLLADLLGYDLSGQEKWSCPENSAT